MSAEEEDPSLKQSTSSKGAELHVAAFVGCLEIAKSLLEGHADVNSQRATSEIRVTEEESKMYLERGITIDPKLFFDIGSTALHVACEEGHEEIVKLLLDYNADLDKKDSMSKLPIHISVYNGNKAITKLLVKKGADVNITDLNGQTALHIACMRLRRDIVPILLNSNADVNVKDCDDLTPIYFAARFRCAAITKLLMDRGADLNFPDTEDLLTSFVDRCRMELDFMKTMEIIKNVSYYDILTTDKNKLFSYAKNVNIVEVLKSDRYETLFPLYKDFLSTQWRKGVKRWNLVREGSESLNSLFSSICIFPVNCTENICYYLSNKDLRNLITPQSVCEVKKPQNKRKRIR